MKIDRGIGSNCSEIIVRLGVPFDEESVKNEIYEMMKDNSRIELGLFKYDWKSEYAAGVPEWKRHDVVRGRFNPRDIKFVKRNDDEDSDSYEFTIGSLPEGYVPEGLQVSNLEDIQGYEINIFIVDHDSGRVGLTDMDGNACLMIGDCDHNEFPVIAEIIRTRRYNWHPWDGGHEDGFVEWCEENGYDDVVDRKLY